MIARIRTYLAKRRLARIVEARRNSPEIVQYRKHREAAKLGLLRRAVPPPTAVPSHPAATAVLANADTGFYSETANG